MSETTYEFEGDPGVVLRGVRWTAHGTSDPDETRDRWTEVNVAQLASGAYIVFGTGRSVVEGETDRHWIAYAADAEELVKALLRPKRGGGKHLPNYAADVLGHAAEKDSRVRAALQSWETAAGWAR